VKKKKSRKKVQAKTPKSGIPETIQRLRRSRFVDWAAGGGLLFLVGFLFAKGLFLPGDRVISSYHVDIFNYFAASRKFGFGELLNGNLPLWNPHIYSGAPYLANFQSALLYPPNFVYLVLPLAKAINTDLAFHVFLAGILMYAWARNRLQHPAAAFFAGAVLMLSQTFFLRVFAGHLTVLAVIAWTPLLFLAVDKLFERPSLGWCLTGIFAVTMQILAGLPQGVFCTAVAVGIYCFLRIGPCRNRPATILALLFVAVVPLFMSAIQLWTGVATTVECTRSQGLSFEYASDGSFPPENFITLVAPCFFGDFTHVMYWGRNYLWEFTVFIGIAGLIMAIYGAVYGKDTARRYWIAMVVILIVIALGHYTPLYRLLYLYMPGFDRFRMPARFMFNVVVFLALLAGSGISALIDKRGNTSAAAIGSAVLSALLAVAALGVVWAASGPPGESAWRHLIDALHATGEVASPPTDTLYETSSGFALK